MEVEILVHINARGRFADDKRYREIAKQVAGFAPATCLKLALLDDHAPLEPPRPPSCSDEAVESSSPALPPRAKTKSTTDQVFQLSHSHQKRSFSQTCELDVVDIARKRQMKAYDTFSTLPQMVLAPCAMPLAAMELKDSTRASEHVELSQHGSYKLHATRTIKAWERGYWLIPVIVSHSPVIPAQRQYAASTSCRLVDGGFAQIVWNIKEFSQFWKTLAEQIKAGRLGMVSLHRTETSSTALGDWTSCGIRLYSWGKAVFHIHRALQLASPRLSDVATACWVGADGQIVLSFTYDPA